MDNMDITFEDFNFPKQLNEALEKLNITTPTPIQVKTYKPILSGRDIMGIAQTGTGKTLAYLLPLLKEYKFSKSHMPKIMILVPTRELVVQVTDILDQLTEFINVRVLGIYGGVNINTQKELIYEGVDILVGTPGRVMDLALNNDLQFKDLKKLVIDEFDEMLSLGFKPQLRNIFSMMSEKRQNILFSATMTDEVDDMLQEYFNAPEEISLARSGTPVEKIAQTAIPVQNFNTKLNMLVEQLKDESIEKLLIFANNKKHADAIFEHIEEFYPEQFGVIHSNKSQNYRLRVMDEFRRDEIRGIVTTDIMARGLDFPDISHVINFEIPEVPEQYIHRIGRTGRADRTGNAISYFSEKEEVLLIEIENLMGKEIEMIAFPDNVKVNQSKRDFEKDVVKMKNPTTVKIDTERGAAFHEKKDKNKKVNLGGPTKRKPPKTKTQNRGQLKQNSKKKRK